jgi:hypothetical protein
MGLINKIKNSIINTLSKRVNFIDISFKEDDNGMAVFITIDKYYTKEVHNIKIDDIITLEFK